MNWAVKTHKTSIPDEPTAESISSRSRKIASETPIAINALTAGQRARGDHTKRDVRCHAVIEIGYALPELLRQSGSEMPAAVAAIQ